MTALALIPARAGSMRFPHKNVAQLAGKPLVAYTIQSVLESRCFARVVVSSDDPQVLKIAQGFDGVEAVMRQPALATSTATTTEVLVDFLESIREKERPQVAGIFLPTSPLRSSRDISDAMALCDKAVDTVISIVPFEAPIEYSIAYDAHSQRCTTSDRLQQGMTRKQDNSVLYRPNGAIYLCRTEEFLRVKSFFKGNVRGLVMPRDRSVDIDEPIDLMLAECILANARQGGGLPEQNTSEAGSRP